MPDYLELTGSEAEKLLYQRGIADGMETAFRLLLGQSVDGVRPYLGPLDPSTQQWAEQLLAAVRDLPVVR
jgi:hypothetical protein